MIEIPDEDRQYINEGFAERLENNSPDRVDVIIEVDPDRLDAVTDDLAALADLELDGGPAIDGKYIPANVRVDSVPRVSRVDGVVLVHQDQLSGIGTISLSLPDTRLPNPADFPPRVRTEEFLLSLMEREDPFAGGSQIGRVEIPRFNVPPTPFGDPLQAGLATVDEKTGFDVYDTEFITTFDSVSWMLNDGLTREYPGTDAQVAVLDTGHTPLPGPTGNRSPHRESFVPGEGALDLNGHGSWVTNTTVGQNSWSPWGPCRGVADESVFAHFKCLNTFPGFGKTSWILRAMDRALDWGADVINMSLGGPQQGPVEEDPYCRFIRENCKENAGDLDGAIFVVAAGNAGPEKWTIGTPGVADKAITVASISLMDNAPAAFSSRGPSGGWYGEHPEKFEEDLDAYGERELVKPDVAAPGGGRETEAKRQDTPEVLWQSETGWMEGTYDGIRDTSGGMAGTSMAAPHVAGFVARLYDAGIITTAAEFKQVLAERQEVPHYPNAGPHANETVNGKNIAVGYGNARESVFNPDSGR